MAHFFNLVFENNSFSASDLTTNKLLMTFPSGELHKRTEIIRSLTKKVKTLESNQIECQTALQKTQLQLQEMAQKATHSALLSEDLETRNENLSNTLVELSAQVGQLQAREQALTTMIKLKDKDIIEAVNHIADCSGKFKLLEHALRDAKMVETCIVKEKQDYKQKLKVLKVEVNKLKGKGEAYTWAFSLWNISLHLGLLNLTTKRRLLASGPTTKCSFHLYRVMLQFLCGKRNNRVEGSCLTHSIFKVILPWLHQLAVAALGFVATGASVSVACAREHLINARIRKPDG